METAKIWLVIASVVAVAALADGHSVVAQERTIPAPVVATAGQPLSPVVPPEDYVIGPEDVLGVVFWRDPELSADVIVRPDGRISLPLVNDVDVAGLTPDQARIRVTQEARRFVEEASASIVIKQINSRKVFITGNVERPGPFPLLRTTSVLQLIALAGGLKEFARSGDIVVVRLEKGSQTTYQFNYDDLKHRKNLWQNITLKPGDTVIVP